MSGSQDATPGGEAALQGRFFRMFDLVAGAPERGVFAAIGHYLPDTSAIRFFQFQHLLSAKFFSEIARDAVKYAAVVTVVASGGSPLAASVMGLASTIPAIAFAMYGGAISDSLPKRVALGVAYSCDAAVCIAIPLFFPDSLFWMFTLVFLVFSLTQVTSPGEQTMVPLVTTEGQLASANSIMGMVSSIGSTIGTAILAPILLLTVGSNAVFYTSAVLLLLAMTRIIYVNPTRDISTAKWIRPKANIRVVFTWLFRNGSIATMVLVAALGTVGYTIMTTLAPSYVSEVLDVNPANTAYVVGTAGIGMALSVFVVPVMIHRIGERVTAGIGFVMLSISIVTLGLVNSGLVDFLQIVNPIHWLDVLINVGPGLGEETELAMFISFPLGLGQGLTANSVRTYLNRRVPFIYQGRTFAAQNLLESALTVVPLVLVSALATAEGVSAAFVVWPLVFYPIALGLVHLSSSLSDEPPDETRKGVLATYWEETDVEPITAMEGDVPPPQPPDA